MSASTLIAGKDLKLRARDRSVFILGVIAPLTLAFIFNIVFGNAFAADSLDLQYGLVDLDQSTVTMAFGDALDGMAAEGTIGVTRYESTAEADLAIDRADVDAYIVLDEGLGEAVTAGRTFTVNVIGDVDEPTSTQIAASIADGFGQRIATIQLSVATALDLASGADPDISATWANQASQAAPPFVIEDFSADTRQLDGPTYFAAGMAVFFLFFTVQFGVLGLLEEEREGTLARLLAAPIPRTSVISGKAILSYVLGLFSMAILVIATTLLMGAEWGPPAGVAILVLAAVLSAVAVMGLVSAFARTPEGASNLGSIVAVILGMLGGTFFPIGRGDDLLSKLSYLTPHAWFMRGLADISGGAAWTAALPATGAMLLLAVVLGTAAWVLVGRRLER